MLGELVIEGILDVFKTQQNREALSTAQNVLFPEIPVFQSFCAVILYVILNRCNAIL